MKIFYIRSKGSNSFIARYWSRRSEQEEIETSFRSSEEQHKEFIDFLNKFMGLVECFFDEGIKFEGRWFVKSVKFDYVFDSATNQDEISALELEVNVNLQSGQEFGIKLPKIKRSSEIVKKYEDIKGSGFLGERIEEVLKLAKEFVEGEHRVQGSLIR